MRIVVAITGASGAPLAVRLLQELRGHEVSLVLSEAGRGLMELEAPRADLPCAHQYGPDDFGAPIASSSNLPDAMVICPCSMRTLAAIAHGLGDNLITRTAENLLRFHRPVVIVPRETPLSTFALRNLTTVAEAGAFVVPPMVTYYFCPQSLQDLEAFCVGKVLDCLGLEHHLYRRWGEDVP